MVHVATDLAGMTPYQSERVQHVLDSLPSINKFGPYRTEEVIVGIVLYVMDEETERFESNDFRDTDRFQEILHAFDTTARRADVACGNVDKYYDEPDTAGTATTL